jgi:hypothetical protein
LLETKVQKFNFVFCVIKLSLGASCAQKNMFYRLFIKKNKDFFSGKGKLMLGANKKMLNLLK